MIIEQTGNVYQPQKYADEKELQALIDREPKLLSIEGAPKLYSVGREIDTDAGPIDVLLVDETGKLVIVEAKLAKNGEIRRRVVAQIIDYVSALSRYTYFDFDDATEGKLGEIIKNFPNPDTTQKLIDNELRSGKVRLVIAVDEANEDLLRIVQFISEHVDFEIDVIEISKYLLNNEIIYNSNIVLKGRETSSGQKRVEYSHELIDQIEEKWNQEYSDNFPKTSHNNAHFRQIRFKGQWPTSIHYEFLKSSIKNYLEVRLDNEISSRQELEFRNHISESMGSFNGQEIDGYKIEFTGNHLVIKIDENEALDKACEVMAGLINLTFDKINRAVKEKA